MTDLIVQPIIEVEITPTAPVEVAIDNAPAASLLAQHESAIDPHVQYAKDEDFLIHLSDQAAHIPDGGITNTLVATNAAIDWAKISKAGAGPGDIGAMPALGTIDQQVGAVKPTTRSTGSALQVGDRWLDTVDRTWWFWNGSYWLSEQILEWVLPTTNFTVSVTQNTRPIPLNTLFNYYFVNFFFTGNRAGTTYDPNNRYDANIRRITDTNFVSDEATASTFAGSTNTRFLVRTTLNVHRDIAALGSVVIDANITKVGTPSDLTHVTARLTYRLVKP